MKPPQNLTPGRILMFVFVNWLGDCHHDPGRPGLNFRTISALPVPYIFAGTPIAEISWRGSTLSSISILSFEPKEGLFTSGALFGLCIKQTVGLELTYSEWVGCLCLALVTMPVALRPFSLNHF